MRGADAKAQVALAAARSPAVRSSAMKRDAAQTIFRTVVFAGAMLGGGAGCSKKAAPTTQTTPAVTTPTDGATEGSAADPCAVAPDPCASVDPCAGGERPRGTDEDGGGGMGRGFVLS